MEFSTSGGKFARRMYGATSSTTSRYMQLSFNRERGALKVLVAQSLVGREGLNLHESCKTVILLHPEWNPGVVEQQTGRIDRLCSLWEKQLKRTAQATPPGALPGIESMPVIFEGSYDKRIWGILKKRWEALRAQLHGIILDPDSGGEALTRN